MQVADSIRKLFRRTRLFCRDQYLVLTFLLNPYYQTYHLNPCASYAFHCMLAVIYAMYGPRRTRIRMLVERIPGMDVQGYSTLKYRRLPKCSWAPSRVYLRLGPLMTHRLHEKTGMPRGVRAKCMYVAYLHIRYGVLLRPLGSAQKIHTVCAVARRLLNVSRRDSKYGHETTYH